MKPSGFKLKDWRSSTGRQHQAPLQTSKTRKWVAKSKRGSKDMRWMLAVATPTPELLGGGLDY